MLSRSVLPWPRLAIVVVLSLAVGVGGWLRLGKRGQVDPEPMTGNGTALMPADPAVPTATILPGRGPDQPEITITPDYQLARVRHKDSRGLAPLEKVETPAGTVTIQRTFRSDDGALLKEEAFLNGKPVRVPEPSK
jgi:hypothetical protein